MSQVTPYLTLYNATEAIEYYKEHFQGEIIGEIEYLSNFEGFEQYTDKVAHCALKIFDTIIFINDNLEEEPLALGDHIQLVVRFEDKTHLQQVYNRFAEEGFVFAELQEVPWGQLSGTVRDKYHVTWMLFIE